MRQRVIDLGPSSEALKTVTGQNVSPARTILRQEQEIKKLKEKLDETQTKLDQVTGRVPINSVLLPISATEMRGREFSVGIDRDMMRRQYLMQLRVDLCYNVAIAEEMVGSHIDSKQLFAHHGREAIGAIQGRLNEELLKALERDT